MVCQDHQGFIRGMPQHTVVDKSETIACPQNEKKKIPDRTMIPRSPMTNTLAETGSRTVYRTTCQSFKR